MAFPFIIQGNNIVVVIDNKPHTISKSHISYEKIKDALKAQDWDAVRDLAEPKKVVLNYGQGNVSIQGDTFLWKGKPLHNALSNRMISMLKEGFPIDPLVQFMDNLMENPSKRAIDELYGFLEKGNLPITPDGHFLAYKKVRDNYFDCHSGTMDNSVGKVVEMQRNEVDDDKDRTCSTGLHFCSISYLSHFGGARTVILKINPRDVVSIPSDYNDSKGRACRYEVIGELNVAPEDAFVKSVQETAVGSQPWPMPAPKVAPVVAVGPKEGTTPFYAGYTAGFTGSVNAALATTDRVAYNEGYAKGVADASKGATARYIYKGAVSVAAQDYDKNGRPLSMTKDAIRKRQQRAAAKAATKVVPAAKPTTGLWPQPKGF